MDKGKRPVSSSSESNQPFTGRRPWKKVFSEAEKREGQKQRENDIFVGKMRRRKNKEDRKGKDWVETKEEYLDIYGINHKLLFAHSDKVKLLKQRVCLNEITESDCRAAIEKAEDEYTAKVKELEDLEDAEYARDDAEYARDDDV